MFTWKVCFTTCTQIWASWKWILVRILQQAGNLCAKLRWKILWAKVREPGFLLYFVTQCDSPQSYLNWNAQGKREFKSTLTCARPVRGPWGFFGWCPTILWHVLILVAVGSKRLVANEQRQQSQWRTLGWTFGLKMQVIRDQAAFAKYHGLFRAASGLDVTWNLLSWTWLWQETYFTCNFGWTNNDSGGSYYDNREYCYLTLKWWYLFWYYHHCHYEEEIPNTIKISKHAVFRLPNGGHGTSGSRFRFTSLRKAHHGAPLPKCNWLSNHQFGAWHCRTLSTKDQSFCFPSTSQVGHPRCLGGHQFWGSAVSWVPCSKRKAPSAAKSLDCPTGPPIHRSSTKAFRLGARHFLLAKDGKLWLISRLGSSHD